MANFEIHIGGYPEAQVPISGAALSLTAEEKDAACKSGITDEQYLRSKLDLAEKGQRLRARATQLGELVERTLQSLGDAYRLVGIGRNIDTLNWTLQVSTPTGFRNVVLPRELVDDVLDSGAARDRDGLKNLVYFGVGRRDAIFQGRT
jgi:hypothetical protein